MTGTYEEETWKDPPEDKPRLKLENRLRMLSDSIRNTLKRIRRHATIAAHLASLSRDSFDL